MNYHEKETEELYYRQLQNQINTTYVFPKAYVALKEL